MHKLAYLLVLLTLISTIDSARAADFLTYSGDQLYQRFCANCHGTQAHGDGRVASSLNVMAPDLTLLTQRNRGLFPQQRLEKIIDGRFLIDAHFTRTMPIWGEEFPRAEIGNPEAERTSRRMISKIVDYLRSIQVVPAGK